MVVSFRAVGHGGVVDDAAIGGRGWGGLQRVDAAILVYNEVVAVMVPAVDIEKQVLVIFAASAYIGGVGGAVDYDTNNF